MSVAVALLSNIESSQNEIISAIYSQIIEFVDEVTIIDFYGNGKINKVLTSDDVDILKLAQYDCKSWPEIKKLYEMVLNEFEKVIIFKTPTMVNRSVVKEMQNGMKVDKQFNWNYDKMRRLYERLLFVSCCEGKEVFQFVIDPREYDFSDFYNFKKYKRICTWKSETDTYGPIYEYAMFNTFVQEIPKMQDLYFIGSVYDESKNYLYEIKKQLGDRIGKRHKGGKYFGKFGTNYNNPMTGKFELFTLEDRDKRVGQSTYLYNLMLSRYTIVSHPYLHEYFNIMRFMEAVICDCVPVVMQGYSNNENLRLTFPDIYDIIRKRGLIMEPKMVHSRKDSYIERDEDVTRAIKATKSFKKITDPIKVKAFYDKLLR